MKIGGLSSGRLGIGHEAQSFSKDRLKSSVLILGVASVLLQGALIFFSWGNLPPQIPIFYSRPWGEMILAQKFFILVLPLVTFVSLTINYFMITFLTRNNLFLSRILIIFSFLVSVMALYDVFKIVSLIA